MHPVYIYIFISDLHLSPLTNGKLCWPASMISGDQSEELSLIVFYDQVGNFLEHHNLHHCLVSQETIGITSLENLNLGVGCSDWRHKLMLHEAFITTTLATQSWCHCPAPQRIHSLWHAMWHQNKWCIGSMGCMTAINLHARLQHGIYRKISYFYKAGHIFNWRMWSQADLKYGPSSASLISIDISLYHPVVRMAALIEPEWAEPTAGMALKSSASPLKPRI